jgi:hypothetical protein
MISSLSSSSACLVNIRHFHSPTFMSSSMVVKDVRFNCIEKVWEILRHHVLTGWCTFEQPQDQRGVANGLSLCLNSISKAMGPAGGGSL